MNVSICVCVCVWNTQKGADKRGRINIYKNNNATFIAYKKKKKKIQPSQSKIYRIVMYLYTNVFQLYINIYTHARTDTLTSMAEKFIEKTMLYALALNGSQYGRTFDWRLCCLSAIWLVFYFAKLEILNFCA